METFGPGGLSRSFTSGPRVLCLCLEKHFNNFGEQKFPVYGSVLKIPAGTFAGGLILNCTYCLIFLLVCHQTQLSPPHGGNLIRTPGIAVT
jgi:hypothetical protein